MSPVPAQPLVLVVEDDPGVAALESETLEDLGCAVRCAGSGEDVLAALNDIRPTLMLLDYSLPDTTAIALLERIGERKLNCPPFIVATGAGDEHVAVELMRRGALNYLVKDGDFLKTLPQAIEQALREVDLRRRLADAEDKLRFAARVLEGTSEAVFVTDEVHCIVDANAAFEQVIGYRRDELIGQKVGRFLLPDAPVQGSAVAAELDVQGHWRGEMPFLRKDGTRRSGWFAISRIEAASGSEPGAEPARFVTFLSDISERKAAEQALRESQIFVQAVLDSVANQIAVIDHEGVIVAVNAAWQQFSAAQGERSGPIGAHTDIGTDYLAVCRAHMDPVTEGDAKAGAGIQSVLDGRLPYFSVEYPWHLPALRRWFTMTVTPLGAGKKGAVIVHTNITERKETELQVTFMAYHDKLTGLPNRSLFFDRFSQAISQARRTERRLALLFVDLDGFKAVNDDYGHEAGDIVLKVVSQRLSTVVRAMDTVARMGGDEFVILLGDLESGQDAVRVAEKVIAEIGLPVRLPDGYNCQVGCSIGISVYPEHGTEMDTLLAAADVAMYRSKHDGKGRHSFAEQSTDLDDASAEWTQIDDNHLVGIIEIDEQHRTAALLLNRINRSIHQSAADDVVKRQFDELAQHIARHFDYEQGLMNRHAYPEAKAHAMAHGRLQADTLHFRSRLYKGGDLFVLQSIKDWLLHHILADDKPLGLFLREKGLR